MTDKKTAPASSQGPTSTVGRGGWDRDKCHLIQHTRKPREERPICLACPYDRCLLERQET